MTLAEYSTTVYFTTFYFKKIEFIFIWSEINKYNFVGNNQHMGSSSNPKEFAIDDLIIPQPQTEEMIRVQVHTYFL